MSDGPFRNLKLGNRWKRVVEAVHNDATDTAQRCALVSDALVREILSDKDTQALLGDLQGFAHQKQLDIDPLASVESIFQSHNKSSFADTLQKKLAFYLSEQMPPRDAVFGALKASVTDKANEIKIRLEEECIRIYKSGEIVRHQLSRFVGILRETLETLNRDQISAALFAGDKYSFKSALSKKGGLDEGPAL